MKALIGAREAALARRRFTPPLVSAPALAETIDRFFKSAGTAFLHVRFPAYGCFAMRIDRAAGGD